MKELNIKGSIWRYKLLPKREYVLVLSPADQPIRIAYDVLKKLHHPAV